MKLPSRKRKDNLMLRILFMAIAVIVVCLLPSASPNRLIFAATSTGIAPPRDGGEQQPLSAARAAREEKAIQDARRQQLAEREAALAAKEQELKKLSAKLEAQIKALEESKKRFDDSARMKKKQEQKQQDEKLKKMIALFKKMRPEQAGQLLDKLAEERAISLLNQMDTKTVAKLVPYVKQPRILKWIGENLSGV